MRAGTFKLALRVFQAMALTGARITLAAAWAILLALTAGEAHADENDLTLERLIGRPATPGSSPAITPAIQSAYAGLVSELGVVMAPRALQPADSLGWSGLAASFESSFTQVNRDADYWQRGARGLSASFLPTIGATVRKGLWLPFPSIELAFGGKKLIGSDMFSLDFAVKLALHEGFHRWGIPSVAVRVAVAQLFGAPQLSLTVLDVGVLVSKRFAVSGGLQLDPYLGAAAIISFATSQVIDTTPDIDAFRQGPGAPDENANVTLPDPGPLPRVRLHAGLRLRASLFQLTVEGAYVLCNGTGRDCAQGGEVQVVDRSGGQAQINLAIGMVY